jgi:hypothetical protein
MENSKLSTEQLKDREILRLFYQGGLQNFLPKDETQIYLNNLVFDSIKFCVKDFASQNPSRSEISCVQNFMTKNFQLLNKNLE